MRATLTAIVLAIVGDAACAQSANEAIKGLEACFEATSAANSICSTTKDQVQGLDCFQKARAAHLECLQHVPSRRSGASAAPEISTGIVSPAKPTGAIPPEMPARAFDIPAKPPDTNWVVSETTSPVDYSPLITAAIGSTSSDKDAPNTLIIRCRQLRTELLLRTEGTWRISRTSEVKVDYQINDQSFVSLQWAASADGKAATYKDDAVGFLRSLPEGARLKINVFDGPGPGHDATFELTGLDAIRKKIAVACKWAPAADKTSLGKR